MTDHQVRMTFDAEADAAYIYVADPIAPGEVVESHVLDHHTPGASLIACFDKNNRLLGIELLGVKNLLKGVPGSRD